MISVATKALAALALAGMSVPAVAQNYPPGEAAAETAQGAGLWIGALMTLVVLGVVIWHDELFDDDEDFDEPVSP